MAVIGRHFGSFRKSQRKTMAALAWGLLMAGRLGLATIARGMADGTSPRHRIKRAWRFASNRRIRIETASACMVQWLVWAARGRPVVALDWTDIGGGRVLLSAAACVGGRAVPLSWTVMGRSQFTRKRKSRNDAEEQMIARLKEAFGEYPWVLVADRGFARADLFRKLGRWGISYVIRACGNPWVESEGFSGRLWDVPRRPGEVGFHRDVLYHKGARVAVSLVVAHAEPAPEPWYLVTNLERPRAAVKAYRGRAWIEEHFRDAKSQMGLDRLRIRRAKSIERLLILMAIVTAVAILIAMDWTRRHRGQDPQLTSHKRGRSLSLFRLGLELARRDGLPPGLARLHLCTAPEAL
jgi:hypothetical protein